MEVKKNEIIDLTACATSLPRAAESADLQVAKSPISAPYVKKLALTVEEMAEALSIGRNSAYELVHIAGFPKIEIGKRIIVPIKPLKKWLNGESLKLHRN